MYSTAQDYLDIRSSFDLCNFTHVKREANQVAHSLAKLVCFIYESVDKRKLL